MKSVKPKGRLQRLFIGGVTYGERVVKRSLLCKDREGNFFWMMQSQAMFSRRGVRERIKPLARDLAVATIKAHNRFTAANPEFGGSMIQA